MSLIDKKVIEEFSTWAEKNGDKHIFPEICKEEGSYYIDRNSEETYMMDYSFETVVELKELLMKYGGLAEESQMLNNLTVEIYKNRYIRSSVINVDDVGNRKEVSIDEEKKLPEFIYVF